MHTNTNATSFHFAVDDQHIIQGLPLDRNAWHAGDGANGYANRNLLAIEICYSKSGGERFEVAEKNAAQLTAHLLTTYHLSVADVHMHREYTATLCPHRTFELGWPRYLEMVRGALEPSNAGCTCNNLMAENAALRNTLERVKKALE